MRGMAGREQQKVRRFAADRCIGMGSRPVCMGGQQATQGQVREGRGAEAGGEGAHVVEPPTSFGALACYSIFSYLKLNIPFLF